LAPFFYRGFAANGSYASPQAFTDGFTPAIAVGAEQRPDL
jgi:hypothetical protein